MQNTVGGRDDGSSSWWVTDSRERRVKEGKDGRPESSRMVHVVRRGGERVWDGRDERKALAQAKAWVAYLFCLFILLMGLSRKQYRSGLPFLSPVDRILSELSTTTHSSWVAPHSIAHSLTELDKAVVHVISVVSFLWLWFSFCLPSDE